MSQPANRLVFGDGGDDANLNLPSDEAALDALVSAFDPPVSTQMKRKRKVADAADGNPGLPLPHMTSDGSETKSKAAAAVAMAAGDFTESANISASISPSTKKVNTNAAAAASTAPHQRKLESRSELNIAVQRKTSMFPPASFKATRESVAPQLKHRLLAKKPSPPKHPDDSRTEPGDACSSPPASIKLMKRTNTGTPATTGEISAKKSISAIPKNARPDKRGRLIPESLRDDYDDNNDYREAEDHCPQQKGKSDTHTVAGALCGGPSSFSVPSTMAITSVLAYRDNAITSTGGTVHSEVVGALPRRRAEEDHEGGTSPSHTKAATQSINGASVDVNKKEAGAIMQTDDHPEVIEEMGQEQNPPFSHQQNRSALYTSAMEIDGGLHVGTASSSYKKQYLQSSLTTEDPKVSTSKTAPISKKRGPRNAAAGQVNSSAAASSSTSPRASFEKAAPLLVCFRSCVMPQPSAYTNRNNYRVVVYQGPFQGRSGFVIREEQVKGHTNGWQSVVEADDNKEPSVYTVSNLHLRMVAALDRSLRPRRQYNTKKKMMKERAIKASTTTATAPHGGGRNAALNGLPSPEDLFLSCLDEQLNN